jgi:pimeloyl-ACP methyl ester carboxylesterase
MILDCTPPAEVIVIPAPEPTLGEAALNLLLTPFQPLREQFTAITGLGLESDEDWDETPGAAPRRVVLAGTADRSRLSYLAAGRPGGQRVVFVHGSPGMAEEWAAFLADVPGTRYNLAVDRPGFGESGEEAEVDLKAQAKAVEPLLTTASGDGVVVVGYSYGGAVALRLAADYPDKVAGLLLIASAADPTREEVHPLQELAAVDFFEALLPRELANANAELLALRPELEELAESLGKIDVPVTVVQGLSDTLVPPENATYLQSMLPLASPMRVILVEDADHFLPWTHPDLLKAALGCVLSDAFGQRSDEESPSDL